MSKRRIPIGAARIFADKLCGRLSAGCERIEIAGSIRRGVSIVGDIEIVCIPHYQSDLLGNNFGNWLDPILERWTAEGSFQPVKSGHRYKQFLLTKSGIFLDLFIVTPETWGIQYMIRTGPAEFSRKMVTQRHQGGYLPDGYRVSEGQVWPETGNAFPTPEEIDVFDLYGMDFIKPEDRR